MHRPPAKKIILDTGDAALVDPVDYPILVRFRWKFVPPTKKNNGTSNSNPSIRNDLLDIKMCNLIMNPSDNMFVHHINHNYLDNRRDNLVVLTKEQFEATKPALKISTTGVKGVSWKESHKCWFVKITVNNRSKYIGQFNSLVKAAMAYNEAAVKYHGEYAYQNDLDSIQEKEIYKTLRINEIASASRDNKWGKLREKKDREEIEKQVKKGESWVAKLKNKK